MSINSINPLTTALNESVEAYRGLVFSLKKSKFMRMFFEKILQTIHVVLILIIETCCAKPWHRRYIGNRTD